MAKMRITITGEYEANPDFYGVTDPAGMAAIDLVAFRDDPYAAVDTMESLTVTVEPVDG